METKTILKYVTSDVGDVLTALKIVNDKVVDNDCITGTYPVNVGSAEVYISENEKSKTFSVKGRGQLFVHLNNEESKLFYVAATILKEQLQFMNKYGQLDHGRFFSEDEILSINLRNDAANHISNEISHIIEYNMERIKNNKKQAEKIAIIR